MLNFLPSPLLFILNSLLIAINVIICATPIMLLGLLRMLLPFAKARRLIEKCNYLFYKLWVFDNRIIIALTNKINWHISGDEIPKINKSCIVISNHVSWLDILFLGCIYKSQIPTTKFFMKHSLIYIPFAGLACYALGMPFLRRYPKEKLLKNPKLRTKDIKTTKAACRRLVNYPTALINFVEGTRFTAAKAKRARSPFKYLMPPKAASFGIALSEIGREIEAVFNTTLYYPDASAKPFIDMMLGKIKTMYVRIDVEAIDKDHLGSYLDDKNYKHEFTMYVRKLWEQKDLELAKMHEEYEKSLPSTATSATASKKSKD